MRSAFFAWRIALVLPALSILVSGCDSAQVRQCEAQLKEKLKAPASYKRVSAEEFVNTSYKEPYDEVTITYDAVNSFNAPLRDRERCFYKPNTTDSIDPFGFNSAEAVDMSATTNATEMNSSEADLSKLADQAVSDAENAMNATDAPHDHDISPEGAHLLERNIEERRARGEIPAGDENDSYPTNDAGE